VSWKIKTVQNDSNQNDKRSCLGSFTEWSRTGNEAACFLLISDLNQSHLTCIGSEFHPDCFSFSHLFPCFSSFQWFSASAGIKKVLTPNKDLTWPGADPSAAVAGACVLSWSEYRLQGKETRICRQWWAFKKNSKNFEECEYSVSRLWRGWKKDVQKMPSSVSQGYGETKSEEVGPVQVLQILRLKLFCSCFGLISAVHVPVLPCSLRLQNVLWGFHCLSLAAYVVISNCSHSIFNMFLVSGFRLRRLLALIEC